MNKPNRLSFTRSREFSRAIAKLVPGGAHTYSRGPDQFPLEAPNGIERGAGARVWDIDNNRLVDWGMALGSVSLGHAHPGVTQAVCDAIAKGVNFTRPSQIEHQAAEAFLAIIGADMVKFAKHGSSVTTAAVKLARAYTGRTLVAVPREQLFFSVDDWFIGTTACDFGIPEEPARYTLRYSYNDLDSLRALFTEHPGGIACVMLEPVKLDPPQDGFLEGVRDLCTEHGAILVFDEMVTGLKWALPGAGSYFGIEPDLSTWGKGIANGFSCAALAGKREIMQLGGLEPEGERKLFLLSTTHGPESTGMAALIATLKAFTENDIIGGNWEKGRALMDRLDGIIADAGLGDYLKVVGYPCLPVIETLGESGESDLALRTLMMQEMIARGILFQGIFVMTPSHGDAEIAETLDAFKETCVIYQKALHHGVDDYLVGPPIKPVFRRHN